MSKFYLKTKDQEQPLYWAGNGWWTRRKDQAKAFEREADAREELHTAVTIEVSAPEAIDADH